MRLAGDVYRPCLFHRVKIRHQKHIKGYIDYKSRGNGQAPKYRMISLSDGVNYGADLSVEQGTVQHTSLNAEQCADRRVGWKAEQCADQSVSYHPGRGVDRYADWDTDWGTNQRVNQEVDHYTDQDLNQEADHLTNHNTIPLVKQKKDKTKQNNTKQNDNAATTDAFVFYQENFGVISPFVSDALLNWVNDVGEALVLDAMKRALERGKSNWGYVKGILQAWAKKGITSVEEAR